MGGLIIVKYVWPGWNWVCLRCPWLVGGITETISTMLVMVRDRRQMGRGWQKLRIKWKGQSGPKAPSLEVEKVGTTAPVRNHKANWTLVHSDKHNSLCILDAYFNSSPFGYNRHAFPLQKVWKRNVKALCYRSGTYTTREVQECWRGGLSFSIGTSWQRNRTGISFAFAADSLPVE